MKTALRAEDDETMPDDTPRTSLPRVTDAPLLAARPPADTHNPLFDLLVQTENDVTGLLAYGLYKQNKRDWLIAYRAREGRDPTQAELESFILGERIPRRIATYRRLAEDMLASDPLARDKPRPGLLHGLMAPPANDIAAGPATAARPPARPAITWRYIAFLLAMLVVMAVLFRFAAAWLFGTGR